jgi:hypothetical protein
MKDDSCTMEEVEECGIVSAGVVRKFWTVGRVGGRMISVQWEEEDEG